MDLQREGPGRFAPAPPGDAEDLPSSPTRRLWTRLRRDRFFWIGGLLALAIVVASALAPILAPHDPTHQYRELMGVDGAALPPSAMFPLGTDRDGRDYLSRLLFAGRATLIVGLGATLAATLIGLVVGSTAGYLRTARVPLPGGRGIQVPVESALMRLTDVGLAFPAILLAIAATAVVGRSVGLVVVIIAAVLWATTARLVHGKVIVLRSAEYVLAARALGCGDRHILRRHIVPDVLPLAVVYGTLVIGGAILFEAALSYLGAGSPTSDPTWGRMLLDGAGYYRTDLRLALLPGLAIMLTVLAFTLIGDALRDATDPRTGAPA